MSTTARAFALAAATLAAVVAAPATAAGPQASVTLFLSPPDANALSALAAQPHLTHAQRIASLTNLTPGNARHATTKRLLTSHGLHVTDETSWTVTVTGPAGAIRALFGTRRTPAGPLADVPAELHGVVTAAWPTTGGPALFRHATARVLDGGDFRNAYTPPGVAPPSGTEPATTNATIATLQLSKFNASDLSTYASKHGLPDPVANGKFKAVTVDGGPSSTDTGDQTEVDLDQEAILATSPSANQHAYFAPNSAAGYGDVFAQVYDDVVGNQFAHAPDAHIVAFSTSWGMCEFSTGKAIISSFEPLITALDAAGVTLFASSGDFGIYDCGDQSGTGLGNTQADVDYPASSPHVIGVGGTHLESAASPSAPYDGSNWTESGWSCSSSQSCQGQIPPVQGTGGSGGGMSGSANDGSSDSFAGFAAPVYQSATVKDAPFAGATKRLVPDVASDGDPETGFMAYTTDPSVAPGGGDVQVGGTSLAAPTSAALFTDALGAAGRNTGVGDIHGAIYTAYAHGDKAVIRDVTSGTNGAASDRGNDPSVSAQVGYDTVTGVGGVLWPGLMPYVLSPGTLGGASSSFTLPSLHKSSGTTTVHATWSVSPGTDRLVSGAAVAITRVGSSTPVYSAFTRFTGSRTFTGSPGATYRFVVRAADIGGHLGPAVTRTVAVPIDDTRFARHGSWSRVHAGADVGGSHLATHSRGAYVSVSAVGRSYSLDVVQCSGCGEVGVYLGSKRVNVLNLYSAKARDVALHFYGGSHTSRSKRTFTFRYLGRKSSRSRGTSVNIDGLTVTT